MEVLSTIGTAVVVFAVTNVDDLALLLTFFSEALSGTTSMKPRHVVIGQYIGLTILIAIGLGGYGIAYLLPTGLVGFLGLLPIIMGLKMFFEIIKERYQNREIESLNETEGKRILSKALKFSPTEGTSKSDLENQISEFSSDETEYSIEGEFPIEEPKETDFEPPTVSVLADDTSKFQNCKASGYKYCAKFMSPQVLKVLGATLGNGGDNIGIYIPLFSQAQGWQIAVTVGVFLLCLTVWCSVTYLLVTRPFVIKVMEKYGKYIVPLVLIGLGLFIIIESHSFPWLVQVIRNKHWGEYEK